MNDIEASKIILNGFLRDLCMPVVVLKDYVKGSYRTNFAGLSDEHIYLSIFSLCMQQIILNCAKYTEFLREYGKVLNKHSPSWANERNSIKSEIERRGINTFRTKFIAHNRCDKKKSPLTANEVDAILKSIAGGDKAIDFLDWVCPDKITNENIEKCIVGIIELTKFDLDKVS
jgi:hypothetical protein